MRALPQKSYKNIGSRWLRTRGWSPPTEIGGVGPEGMESPTVNGGGPLVGGDAVNVGVGPMPSHVNGGGVVMAQSFSHGPRVNQGDVSQNRGKDVVHSSENALFENFWVSHPDCEDVVRRNWSSLAGQNIGRKIQECGTALQQWGKDVFGKFSSRIKQCNRLLKQYKKRRDEDGNRLFYEAKKELFAVLSQREVFWRQRSKQLWLQAGDQNSKFFHSKASARKRNNHITMLKDSEGNFRQWDNGLENVVVDSNTSSDLRRAICATLGIQEATDNNMYVGAPECCLVGKSVDSLMKVEQVEWDGEVLADLLTTRDRALVWKIPLSSHLSTDLWYWLHDALGVFTVRSAYSLLQLMKPNRDSPDNSGIWRLLWQLQLPPKLLEQGSNYWGGNGCNVVLELVRSGVGIVELGRGS
ncbi:hypothetical protein G4B88_019106 [Cannabis sativa]|uniref:Uncharacterized protein n=1 Tax=Cannabis sativa TaxID=3483 RepID=A0A7J6H147_CANSA|nr:hypothetical protein G4B88_019106 [Cannabis sativa]